MVPLPSKLAEMSVDSILKDSDLWWWLIKEKLKVSQPRGFYMQKLRSPLKSISLKGKLINPFMIKWLFLILWWNLNAVDGIFKSCYNEVLGSLCSLKHPVFMGWLQGEWVWSPTKEEVPQRSTPVKWWKWDGELSEKVLRGRSDTFLPRSVNLAKGTLGHLGPCIQ